MLVADSIYHDFSGNVVLSGCYLDCKPGEIVGLLGRNGSGKSTLLKIIFGLINAKHQHLKINDKIINRGYKNQNIAYLPQQNFLPDFLKIKDIIKLYKLPENLLLNFLEKEKDFMQLKISKLSTGQQRMLETFIILHHPAEYILLDEPFSQISPVNGEKLIKLISSLKNEKGIILTDHYYRNILKISDKIYLMKNGACYTIKNDDDLIFHQYIPEDYKPSEKTKSHPYY